MVLTDSRIDEANMHYKTYVDIKSEPLRDVLREVLEGVNTVSLRGDKPEVSILLKSKMSFDLDFFGDVIVDSS